MQIKLAEVWTCGSKDKHANEQTCMHTDMADMHTTLISHYIFMYNTSFPYWGRLNNHGNYMISTVPLSLRIFLNCVIWGSEAWKALNFKKWGSSLGALQKCTPMIIALLTLFSGTLRLHCKFRYCHETSVVCATSVFWQNGWS